MLVVLPSLIFHFPLASLLTGIFLLAGIRISFISVCLRVGVCCTQLSKAEVWSTEDITWSTTTYKANVKLNLQQILAKHILVTLRTLFTSNENLSVYTTLRIATRDEIRT
jgi:hypothetical protein